MDHSRGDSPGAAANPRPEKKLKTNNHGDKDENFAKAIRTAFDLNFAFGQVRLKFAAIGNVVTIWPFEGHPAPQKKQQSILKRLSEVNKETNKGSRSYCFGNLRVPFHLKVTYPGCEFEDTLRFIAFCDHNRNEDTIQRWLKNAPTSGFGDNKALETKIDPEVRKASEIPAEGFEVKQELLETIARIWSDNFLPANVRVQPYKIHIYGKGGHFKSHRDTPEKSLVGTFLLGIGDSTISEADEDCDCDCDFDEDYDYGSAASEVSDGECKETGLMSGNFCIGNIRRTSKTGQWVAFHPDVPHSVEPLARGCRAAIAFKIFSVDNDDALNEAFKRYPSFVEQTKGVLADLKGRFGIVLQHQYPMGVDENGLIGVDAVILAAAKQVRSDVKVIPVVVSIFEERIIDSIACDKKAENEIKAKVYPFTRHHVDICLDRVDDVTHEAVAWTKKLKNIPFYSWDFKENSMRWSSNEEEINHTGNESDGTRETSLYLAYAIVAI